ncbi:MAG: hypothetical protein N3A53_05330 [Verrucomicrobiae bacterium]|nr:hypothetical protein [Verrucomicrobiae bacterium]
MKLMNRYGRRWRAMCAVLGLVLWLGRIVDAENKLPIERAEHGVRPMPRVIVVPPPDRDVTGAAPLTQQWDRVVFRNWDILSGRLLRLLPGREMHWEHPEARGPLVFDPRNVLQIKFAGEDLTAGVATGAVVQLTNGDELRGVIRNLDGEKLVLQTTYSSDLAILRTMVQMIMPGASDGSILYQGPTGLADWFRSQSERGWSYADGGFVLPAGGSGVIGRDVKLSDRCRIEFDLEWRVHPFLLISLYGDNPENFHGNAYVLHLTGNSLQLQRGRVRGGMNMLGGGAMMDNLMQRGRVRLGILVDKDRRTIVVTADGNVVRQWTDPAEFAGGGTWLMFMGQGQGPLRISNLVVRNWDGQLDASVPEQPVGEDLMRLTNNDKVSGELRAIRDGRVFFQTAFATLEVPLDRVLRLEFARNKAERARRQANDVRAWFHAGGCVTIALEKMDERQLVGSSENFGTQTFQRSAFREVRFAIYDETARLPRSGDAWGEWGEDGN